MDDKTIAMAGEHPKKVELAAGKVEWLAVERSRMIGDVNPERANGQDRWHNLYQEVAQKAPDAGQKLLHAEGLDHVVLRTCIECCDLGQLIYPPYRIL